MRVGFEISVANFCSKICSKYFYRKAQNHTKEALIYGSGLFFAQNLTSCFGLSSRSSQCTLLQNLLQNLSPS